MPTSLLLTQLPTFMGIVSSLQVAGSKQNSAEITVTVRDDSKIDQTFRVGAYPATEPSVFTSFASLLASAYLTKTNIEISYLPVTGETPQLTAISFSLFSTGG